jgi:IS4 transposase
MYKKRWVIENNAFKELSEHWNLTKKPGGKFNTICCHLYFTLAVYNLVLLFKTKYAKKLMGRTIMTLRNKLFSTAELAVVYVQGCC